MIKMKNLEIVMQGLMSRYAERVPDVKKITQAMVNQGLIKSSSEIENDHVAFRTLGVPQLGIKSFEKIFLSLGYVKKDYYHFEAKKLDAFWFAPPEDHFPRIFVSELRVKNLSKKSQDIISQYTDQLNSDPVDSLDLNDPYAIDDFLHKALWHTPSWEHYQDLLSESEYAAWVIYNRYYLNHYTISVHNLPESHSDIYKFNEFLENIGIKLNDSGGKVKVSPDKALLQSSTVAQMVEAVFADGSKHIIAGSYVEFAERKILDSFKNLNQDQIQRKHRREGFEAGNADKIFESTFTSQTLKKD
jgi:hypothetical protein